MLVVALGKAYIEVKADLSTFPADLRAKLEAAFKEATAGMKFETLDESAKDAGKHAADDMADEFEKEAEPRMKEAGKKSGKSFFSGLSGVWKVAAAAFLPTLIALGIEAGSYLLPAVYALAAAIPGAAAVAVGALGTVMVATHGVGAAIKAAFSGDPAKLAEALKKLAPAAQAFVMEINKARPVLHQLQQDIQQAFFVQLNGGVSAVLKMLPSLRSELAAIAGDMGRIFGNVAHTLAANATAVHEILLGIHFVLQTLSPVGSALTQIFLTLAAVGLPFVDTLARGLGTAVENFRMFIQEAANSGALAQFFDSAVTILKVFGGLLGSALRLVGDITSALQSVGGNGLSMVKGLLDTLDAYFKTAQGKQTLVTLFQLLNTALDSLFKILTPLLPLVGQLVTDLAGGLTDALKTITPYLVAVADFLARHPGLIKDAIAAWGAYKLALLEVSIAEAIVDALDPLTWVVLLVAAVTALAVIIVLNWGKIKNAAIEVWHAIENAGKAVWSWLKSAAETVANFFVGIYRWFEALPGKIANFVESIPGDLERLFLHAAERVGYAIGYLIGFAVAEMIKLPGQVLGALEQLPGLLLRLWDRASGWVMDRLTTFGVDAIVFFESLPGRVVAALAKLPGVLKGLWDEAFNRAKGAVISGGEAILDWVSRLPGRIAGFFANVGHSIVSGLRSAFNDVIRQINKGIDDAAGPLHAVIPHIPYLAKGAIVDSPTMAMIGEAGREVVIPTSDPVRAKQLADQSGLTQLLAQGAPTVNVQVIAMLDTGDLIGLVDTRVVKTIGDEAAALATNSKTGGF